MFEVVARDGLARIGRLETSHGPVLTPALMPVVHPIRRFVSAREMRDRFGAQIVITNAYILYASPQREEAREQGVHGLLDFDGPVMTDSGAFQAHVYGDVAVDNAAIVAYQRALGTDVGTVLDVFSEPEHDAERAARDVEETVRRAREAAAQRGEMLLVGAVQGGVHEALRERCARALSAADVDIHAIGGVVPLMERYRFRDLVRVVLAAKRGLVPHRPVHLFGAGHPMLFALAALLGCDLFDSSSYAKFARGGRLLFPDGTRHLAELRTLPCDCPVCATHLPDDLRADERLVAEHNLYVSFAEMRRVRQAIHAGDLWELVERRCRAHPALLDALRELRRHNEYLERFEPITRESAAFFVGPESVHRPLFWRYRRRLQERYTPPPRRCLVILPEGERPYGRTYAALVERIAREVDVHFVVRSVWGPVPLELDQVHPISQSVVPESLDAETLEAMDVFLRRFVRGAGFEAGAVWDGEATLNGLPRAEAPPEPVDWDRLRLVATADMQFGRGAAAALFDGTVELRKSKRTGRIRNVFVDGEHVLSLRAADGWCTLRIPGAVRLHRAFSKPTLRVVVASDTAAFPRDGRSVFARFVVDADEELRPRDEVLVVDEEDALLAVGQARLNREEMLAFDRGVAVRVREGVPSAD